MSLIFEMRTGYAWEVPAKEKDRNCPALSEKQQGLLLFAARFYTLSMRPIRRAGRDRDWVLQTEREQRLRPQFYLLSTSDRVCTCTCTCSCRRADCSALPATKDSAENRAHCRASSDLTGSVLPTCRTLF